MFQKLPKENPFDLVQPQVQRFYFNNSSGKITSVIVNYSNMKMANCLSAYMCGCGWVCVCMCEKEWERNDCLHSRMPKVWNLQKLIFKKKFFFFFLQLLLRLSLFTLSSSAEITLFKLLCLQVLCCPERRCVSPLCSSRSALACSRSSGFWRPALCYAVEPPWH